VSLTRQTAGPAVPAAMRAEHTELHRVLNRARREPGPVGEAAAEVAKLLHRHFLVEEQVALPCLSVLKVLAEGGIPDDAAEAIALAQRLKDELPRMAAEHREYLEFAEHLMVHAELEEEVLYPAAILAGNYLKLVTQR
jgi:hypothetical protein